MLYLILATIFFSLSFGLIKSQLVGISPELVAALRLVFATLIFIPFIKKFDVKKQFIAFLIGMIQFGVMYLAFINAFKYLQGNEIALLTTTTPLYVALFSMVLGEKFKSGYVFCILLSILGAVVVVWQNASLDFVVNGVLCVELSNIAFAVGQILWKKYLKKEKESNLMFSAYLGAAALTLGVTYFNSQFFEIKNIAPAQWVTLFYLGVVTTGVGFFLWNMGVKTVKVSTLAIMNNLKIPMGVLFSIIIFREHINYLNFAFGSLLILFAIWWSFTIYKKL